jgi:hypothetical protein
MLEYTAPQINDLLTAMIHATGATELVAPNEILSEGSAHGLKARADVAFNLDAL